MVQAVARDALHAEPAHVILRELGHFRRESNSQAPQLASQGSQPHAGEGLCQTCPCTKSVSHPRLRSEVADLQSKSVVPRATSPQPDGPR